MPDIIKVLPDSVANQIAAGEVIQRPASVVKELLENAIDAGSSSIQVIVKDSGKSQVLVIDNGCGMSETDARLCLERHATSKISKASDLFNIRTLGFRGEALASIAAISYLELKTKRVGDEVGAEILVEGSEVKGQTVCGCPEGTSVSVKNLFYNVPARRNFLKSNPVETNHIIDEFQRVALAHPQIAFSLFNNDNELFHLPLGQLRQRIVNVFGRNYNQRLVPVEEETSLVKITGFISKPEFAKKTRGEQFFFVNQRFIKNGYFHHAMLNAFSELIPKDCHPSYFIFIETDPKSIDINIHPTKTEIKFENERAVYAILLASVKKSLGKYNIAPLLDFNTEMSFETSRLSPGEAVKIPEVRINPKYNPFSQETKRENLKTGNFEVLYKSLADGRDVSNRDNPVSYEPETNSIAVGMQGIKPFQIHNRYIITQIKSGLLVIDQQNASERILYEKYLTALSSNKTCVQKQLFTHTIELSAGDFELAKELMDEVNALGFEIREFGKNALIIEGVPADSHIEDAETLLENVLEQFKNNVAELKIDKQDNLARSLAKNLAVKPGKLLQQEEMLALIDELFACKMPYYSPNGIPALTTITMDDLNKKFGK